MRNKNELLHNSLAAKSPAIAAEVDPDANGGLIAAEIPNSSTRNIAWRCNNGHCWVAAVVQRTKRGQACPACKEQQLASTDSVAARHPQLAAEWYEAGIDPRRVPHSSNKPVRWKCPEGHEWVDSPNRRAGAGRYKDGGVRQCPECTRTTLTEERSLAVLRPDLAAQWREDLDGSTKASDVPVSSTFRAWWECGQGHVWQAKVFWRSQQPGNCPYCTNHRLRPERSLAVMRTDLVAEWDTERNGDLRPEAVSVMSGRKVWWKTTQAPHVRWQARVADRSKGEGCPGVHGHMVTETNSLAALHPDLATSWHPQLNGARTPHEVTAQSGEKAWWLDRDCGHAWKATVKNRVRGTGCPECNLVSVSRAEHRVRCELSFCFEDIPDGPWTQQVERIDVPGRQRKRRTRSVDIYLPGPRVAIEYDGVRWHRVKHEEDCRKNKELEASGLRVIRLRERGLALTSDLDIAIGVDDGNLRPHVVAAQVIRKLADLGVEVPRAAVYLAAGRRMRAAEAAAAWASKRRRAEPAA